MTDYQLLTDQLRAFCEEEPFYVPLFANAAALLWQMLPDVNWAGFYVLRNGVLVLGPFQGKPACIRIAAGRGVCGAAVRENRVQRVADVHRFPGHIACDSVSNAEIVVPIRQNGAAAAVLDIDSPTPGRFTREDEEGLTGLAAVLEEFVSFR